MKQVLLLLICVFQLNAQNNASKELVEDILNTPETQLPLFSTENLMPRIGYGVRPDMTPTISFHSYDDLGGKVNFGPLVAGELYSWSNSLYNYKIGIINMGEVDRYRMLLATLSEQGVVIDTVEVEIYFYSGNNRYLTKEFVLNKSQQLIISQLESKEETPIKAYSGYKIYQAQRVDSYYQIDSKGKIILQKKRYYKPRTYDVAYIENGKKRLIDGDEEFEKEEIIQKE